MSGGIFRAGCVLAGLGVVLGAFGAHALRGRVDDAMLAVWETGVQYHLVHALALLIVAVARPQGRLGAAAGPLFAAGIVLFSGSLYALVLTGTRLWGAVTPLGGLAFILGWLVLAVSRVSPKFEP
jgi:uncharacterized membrane protein YgdD (TMEM256/DUF423 family)